MKNKNVYPTLLLKKVVHRKEEQLLLHFNYNDYLKERIKSIGGYRWSKTLKGWYTIFNSENIIILKESLKNDVKFKADPSLYKKPYVKPIRKERNISEDNKQLIRLYVSYLKGKCYSESTIKVYFTFIADFFDYLQDTPIISITNRTVEEYIEAVFVPNKYSINTHRQFISAVKLFSVFYPECKINEFKLQHQKRNKILPTVTNTS